MTPNDEIFLNIISDARVSDRAVRLWLALLALGAHETEMRVHPADYGELLHCSLGSVRRALASLTESGWASVRRISPRVSMVTVALRRSAQN